jgi:hypothetical protein
MITTDKVNQTLLIVIFDFLPRDVLVFFDEHRAGGRGRVRACYQYLVPTAP